MPTFERHHHELADKDAIITELQQQLALLQHDLAAKDHHVQSLQGRVELLEKDFRLSQGSRRNRAQRSSASTFLPPLPSPPLVDATNDELRAIIEEQNILLQDQRRSLRCARALWCALWAHLFACALHSRPKLGEGPEGGVAVQAATGVTAGPPRVTVVVTYLTEIEIFV